MADQKAWLLDEGHLEERIIPVREFVCGRGHLGLGDVVFPEIVRTLERLFSGAYDEAVLVWGIGSGKSYLASLAISYMVYCLLCLRNPQASLGMARGSRITLLIMAPSSRQARDVVFADVARLVCGSRWFQSRAREMEVLADRIRFPKGVEVIAGNSSSTFALGYNVIGAVIDEAAWFPRESPHGRERVEEIYLGLKRRMTSRFLGRGLMILISSPRAVGDFMERRLEQSQKEERTLGLRRAVWEVRPEWCFGGAKFSFAGLEIPVEFRRDFELNPARALRDLAAQPTRSRSAFLADPLVLERAIDGSLRHPLDAEGRLAPWFCPKDDAGRYVHVDLGLTRDACGLAMAHCVQGPPGETKPRVVVELMHCIEAPAQGEVDLSRPREIILGLRSRGFRIEQVSYDGWQSADSRQILGRHGIATKIVSVDRTPEAYETLKELLLDGRLSLYRHERFMSEASELELHPAGRVDHPAGGSKDLADAVAGAVSEAVRNWRTREMRAHVV